MSTSVTVALDAMGSDRGPEAIVAGARDAVAEGGLRILLCGNQSELADRKSTRLNSSHSS